MIQKCSYLAVLEIFFKEPNNMHFIREISKKINLAHTSVRKNIKDLIKDRMILKKKSKPFDGYVANLENEMFLFYKRVYNLYSIYDLRNFLIESLSPKAIVLFGSYATGRDREESDIDILIISKTNKILNVSKFEKGLQREINIICVNSLNKIDKPLKEKIINGISIYGGISDE
jgi:predicted nucleotidyltransferase